MHLSIIIPVYNEADVITKTLDRLRDTLMPTFVESTEVIIVDDCSTDRFAELAEIYKTANLKTKLISRTRFRSGQKYPGHALKSLCKVISDFCPVLDGL